MTSGVKTVIKELRVEHYNGNVLGINTNKPRISWRYSSGVNEDDSVQLEFYRSMPGDPGKKLLITTDINNNILYKWPLEKLRDREMVAVRARIVTVKEQKSQWSEPLKFDVGILDKYELLSRFIGPSWFEGTTDHRRLPVIRKKFLLKGDIVHARLYVSALGLVEPTLNGKKITDNILIPGWTNYENRVECWEYDIKEFLNAGKNVIDLWLGDGWYRGRLGFRGGVVNHYGKKIGVFAQIEITYFDGSTDRFYSNAWDKTWKCIKGPILESGLCEGEIYDANQNTLEFNGNDPLNISTWQPVTEISFDNKKIEMPISPAVRPKLVNSPVSLKLIDTKDGKGKWLIDFGQNCTQRLHLNVSKLEKNDRIIIHHAEVLNSDGTLATRPLRRGKQTDVYVSDGVEQFYEPKFTIHGFRYLEIENWPGKLCKDDVYCNVYYSDMKRTGTFNSSNTFINQLHDNVLWSMRSNFVSIPTDCPQRDERLGWTGDIALFSPTASYLYDTTNFLSNWLKDVRYDQVKLGTVPAFVPFVPLGHWDSPQALAIWGDSAVIVPWTLYMDSGDKKLLRIHYPLASSWIAEVSEYLSKDGVWDRRPNTQHGQLGDWLDPTAPSDNPAKAMTQKELVATAFFAHSCQLMSLIAEEIDLHADAKKYHQLFQHIKSGFINRFVKSNGLMTSDTECAYALAIEFNLFEDMAMRARAGKRLAEIVKLSSGKVQTGFAGTPYVLPALTHTGHNKEAFELFLSEKCPSWLYQVKMGATTTWERWDSMLPNGSLNPGEMTSFNHYALGSVANWMHEVIGGLYPVEPAWKKIIIQPQSYESISEAQTSHETPYGNVEVDWYVDNNCLTVRSTIPSGVIGEIIVPGNDKLELEAGFHVNKFDV